jgi:hypothetical protein
MQRKLQSSEGTMVLPRNYAPAPSTHPEETAEFAKSKQNRPVIASILLVALIAASLCGIMSVIGRGLSTNKYVAINKIIESGDGDGDHDDSTAFEHRLCEQNQYAKSLSLPLSGFAELMDEWIANKVEHEYNLSQA